MAPMRGGPPGRGMARGAPRGRGMPGRGRGGMARGGRPAPPVRGPISPASTHEPVNEPAPVAQPEPSVQEIQGEDRSKEAEAPKTAPPPAPKQRIELTEEYVATDQKQVHISSHPEPVKTESPKIVPPVK